MKEMFENPEVELIELDEDVIATSGCDAQMRALCIGDDSQSDIVM